MANKLNLNNHPKMKHTLRVSSSTMFMILLILKVTEIIDISWWWVFAPIWLPVALFFAILLFILLGSFLVIWWANKYG